MRLLTRAFGAALGLALAIGVARADDTIKAYSSAAAESNHVFCSAHCVIRSLYVTTGGTAGYLMVFDATSAPADGAVTPVDCVVAPANTTTSLDFDATGQPTSTGFTAVFSSTGCFTKTASATAFFKARHQP